MRSSKCNYDVDDFMLPFFGVFKRFRRRMSKDFTPMSPGQIIAAHYLLKHKHVAMKDLSKFLEITPPSATSMIDKMEKIKFVKREFDPSDRRTISISLTKTGLKMFEKAKKEKLRMMKHLLKRLTPEERETLLELLNKMVKSNEK